MSPGRKPVRRIVLQGHHKSRGRVGNFVEGKAIDRPASLEIVRPTAGDACHIVYIDSAGLELSETWHQTIDAAIYHAKWEYGIQPEEWENLEPSLG